MKAAVWHARRDLRVDEIPEPPTPGPHDVKIRVDWCGICGTDLEEYANGPMYIPVTQPNPLTGGRAPLVIGHEFVGTIVQAGSAVEHLSIGDRVAPDTILFCRECPPCRAGQVHQCERLAVMGLMADGGCAELVNAPAYMCFKLPDHIPSEVGALAEPAAVAVRAVKLSGANADSSVAIIGGGTIGLLCLQVARARGIERILLIEPESKRRALATTMGASAVCDPAEQDPEDAVRDAFGSQGASVVIECAGNAATLSLAPQLAAAQGTVVITGLHDAPVGINLFPTVCKEITIKGSFAHIYDQDFAEAVRLIGSAQLDPSALITRRIAIDDIVRDGFEALLHDKSTHLKILIQP